MLAISNLVESLSRGSIITERPGAFEYAFKHNTGIIS